jgi:hypothetical protein
MEVHDSLRAFAESNKALVALFPDLREELRSLAIDEARQIAIAYLVIKGTHTGEGGPVPPTGKAFEVDAVRQPASARKVRSAASVASCSVSSSNRGTGMVSAPTPSRSRSTKARRDRTLATSRRRSCPSG